MKCNFENGKVYEASGSTQMDTFELNQGDHFKVILDEEDQCFTIFNLTTDKHYCFHDEEIPIVLMIIQFILMDSKEVQ